MNNWVKGYNSSIVRKNRMQQGEKDHSTVIQKASLCGIEEQSLTHLCYVFLLCTGSRFLKKYVALIIYVSSAKKVYYYYQQVISVTLNWILEKNRTTNGKSYGGDPGGGWVTSGAMLYCL